MDRSHENPTQPTPAPDDGTPTNDPAAALHWAAVAIGLAEARTEQGHPLTDTERAAFDRYQDAARAHGHTDRDVRAYAATLSPASPPPLDEDELPEPIQESDLPYRPGHAEKHRALPRPAVTA